MYRGDRGLATRCGWRGMAADSIDQPAVGRALALDGSGRSALPRAWTAVAASIGETGPRRRVQEGGERQLRGVSPRAPSLPRASTGQRAGSGCGATYPYAGAAAWLPGDMLWMIPALGAALALLPLVVALEAIVPPSGRVAARVAQVFAAIGSSLLIADYAIQFGVVAPSLRGDRRPRCGVRQRAADARGVRTRPRPRPAPRGARATAARERTAAENMGIGAPDRCWARANSLRHADRGPG
jgi:hypothetical protein